MIGVTPPEDPSVGAHAIEMQGECWKDWVGRRITPNGAVLVTSVHVHLVDTRMIGSTMTGCLPSAVRNELTSAPLDVRAGARRPPT